MTPYTRLLILAAFAAAVLFAAAAWFLRKKRVGPEEKERRRRAIVGRIGRMRDGMITDFNQDTIFYSYEVMGVDYITSQDAADLQAHLPAGRESLIGPVTLKYLPRNPANSIVLCESWSGLRPRHQTPILISKEGEITT